MVTAYELRKAGFDCALLEARERPGGRNWTIRNGSEIEFTDGSVQHCSWQEGQYLNAGPARIPSIHRTILGYCEQLGVPLEVEINASRSALMQSDGLNGGRAVEQRQIVYDTRGHLAELFSKAIHRGSLDSEMTGEDVERLLALVRAFGDLNPDFSYTGTERGGYAAPRTGGPGMPPFKKPLALRELLSANFVKGEFYEDRLDWQATMLQPVGGMDRIAYAFAGKLGNSVRYRSVVREIRRSADGVRIVYTSADRQSHTLEADYCICTLPMPILRDLPADFSSACRDALRGMPMVTQYKIGWEAPRFWEREHNIYGGISFLNDVVDLVWYPSDRLFSSHGVLISGFNFEADDAGRATAFGSLGSFANNHLESSQPAYDQLHRPEGNIFFAGDYVSRIVGWQEGAALSAHYVVAEIAERVRSRRVA